MIVNLSKTEHAVLSGFLADLADLLNANCSTLIALPNDPDARKLARAVIAAEGGTGKPEVVGNVVQVNRAALLRHLQAKVNKA